MHLARGHLHTRQRRATATETRGPRGPGAFTVPRFTEKGATLLCVTSVLSGTRMRAQALGYSCACRGGVTSQGHETPSTLAEGRVCVTGGFTRHRVRSTVTGRGLSPWRLCLPPSLPPKKRPEGRGALRHGPGRRGPGWPRAAGERGVPCREWKVGSALGTGGKREGAQEVARRVAQATSSGPELAPCSTCHLQHMRPVTSSTCGLSGANAVGVLTRRVQTSGTRKWPQARSRVSRDREWRVFVFTSCLRCSGAHLLLWEVP